MSQNKHFSKKTLQLISLLTRNQKLLDTKKMSELLKNAGQKVCERTVRRWFDDLQRSTEYFDYYPVPRYEKLGLVYSWVFINGLKNMDLIKIIPYNTYFISGTHLQSLGPSTVVAYFIPKEHLTDFENYWKAAQKLNLFDSYELFDVRDTVYFYSKFHETFHNGVSNFTVEDNNYFFDILDSALKRNVTIELDKNFRENPLTVAIVLERFRESWSSTKVWRAAKEKLGEGVWDYVKDLRTRLNRSDASGIRLAQKTLGYVNENFDKFFRQIKVDYAPVWSHKNNLFVHFILDIGTDGLSDFVKILHKNSIQCAVFLPYNNPKRHMFFAVTDFSGLDKVVHSINSLNAKKSVLWVDREATKKYWTRDFMKFDYSKVFDPKKCEWVYQHNKYMAQLEKLAQPSV